MSYLTRETVDFLWPKHGRTSCSDDNLNNRHVHHEDGSPRCNRCMGLDRIGEPLSELEITADIKVRQPRGHGTVLVFKEDAPVEEIMDALVGLNHLLSSKAELHTFNPDHTSGPVWYTP